MSLRIAIAGFVCLGALTSAADARPADDPEQFFEAKIRPVLAETCVKCHGPTKAGGHLRLDSREAMLKGGDKGPALVPGNPEESLIVQAVRHDDDAFKMPPDKALPKQVRADLTAWIASGATWPKTGSASAPIEGSKHWAFEPIKKSNAPVDPTGWAVSPIDRLVSAEQRTRGLKPVAAADRRTLIRRAYFDLIGLPPEPAKIEAFVNDKRTDAFARVIDELLASPRYGERWGRYWLDLARYADTAGDNSDYPIPEAYLYRDYVIDAFNADIPYDRFLHEQLAGDILAKNGPRDDFARRVIATGFIAQAKRFGTRKLEDPHQIIEDNLQTTGQVVLGLSLRCARCHDHKFDPITSADYYSLYGYFAGTKYPFAGAEEDKGPSEFAPLVPADLVKQGEAKRAELLAKMKADLADLTGPIKPDSKIGDLGFQVAQADWLRKAVSSDRKAEAEKRFLKLQADAKAARKDRDAKRDSLKRELTRFEKSTTLPGIPVAYAVREGTPTDARIQKGGNPRRLGDVVKRSVPKILDPNPNLSIPPDTSGRLQLAQWLTTGPVKSLTARVMANRIWQHHFGKPIVATPSDFGLRGIPPTHPQLLDELADEFIRSGWSIKRMHRLIMTSKTYQLASTHDQADFDKDSGNTYYWHFDRRKLDAEALRDSVMTLAGSLDLARPGAHPFPPLNQWRWTAHYQFKAVYPSNHRSVYLMVQRLHPHPYLALFNGPDTSQSTAVRDDSAVPLQALYLLNSPFIHEQASLFAQRLLNEESDPVRRLELAYERTFGRPPSEAEIARSERFAESYRRALETEGCASDKRELEVWAGLARVLFASNEFIHVD